MKKIIAIDDDERILRLIKKALSNYQVDTFANVQDISVNTINQYELMLLDVMMPEVDGFEYCKKIREYYMHPILFLTAKSDESSMVEGLTLGADDYIVKPFSINELSARISAHLRGEQRQQQKERNFLIDEFITIDFDLCKIFVNQKEIHFTKTQYLICKVLASNKGRVLSKEIIYEKVFPYDSNSKFSTVVEHIRVIRKKFEQMEVNPIDTVWGIGYVWK